MVAIDRLCSFAPIPDELTTLPAPRNHAPAVEVQGLLRQIEDLLDGHVFTHTGVRLAVKPVEVVECLGAGLVAAKPGRIYFDEDRAREIREAHKFTGLEVAIAHQLAHVVLAHLVPGLPAAAPATQQELDADRLVGEYLSLRASREGAVPIWDHQLYSLLAELTPLGARPSRDERLAEVMSYAKGAVLKTE